MENMDTPILTEATITRNNLIPSEIKELYLTAFPEKERRDWNSILQLIDSEPAFRFFIISSGGATAGFITAWTLGAVTYVEHFATLPQLRGRGIGANVIRQLKAESAAPVALEVEMPGSSPEADRRIAFYIRCGFTAHPQFHYVQPPYSPSQPPVRLMLMTSEPSMDLEAVSTLIHRKVYGQDC